MSKKLKDISKEIKYKKSDLDRISTIACFEKILQNIHYYILIKSDEITQNFIIKNGKVTIDELKSMLKSSFQLTQENIIKIAINKIVNSTFDYHTQKICEEIFKQIDKKEQFQSYLLNVDAYINERNEILKKKSFIFLTDENISEITSIDRKLIDKYMIPNIKHLSQYLNSIKQKMIIDIVLSDL